MAQASPTNALLAQAAYRLEQLSRQYNLQKNKGSENVLEAISKVVSSFEGNIGKSLAEYNPIHHSEVPNSSRMNRFWKDVEADINILQQQIDLLRAGAVSSHNFIKTEIAKASRETLKAQNKLKTLELYSNSDDSSLVYFGDTFITEDFIDSSFSSTSASQLMVMGNQTVGLGLASQKTALDGSPTVLILEGSNGMIGNNEEIVDPSQAVDGRYTFKSEFYAANELDSILDGEPTTWVEFEKYFIHEADRNAALNYNFNYKVTSDSKWSYLSNLKDSDNTFNWADGLGSTGTNGTLVLNLEVDLGSPRPANTITLSPFGLEDNVNSPIKIKRVSTSLDKSVWTTLGPQNMWLANSIDRKIVDVNDDNIVIGQGVWVSDGTPFRFIRFEIEQPASLPANIGHFFYFIPETNEETSATRELGPIPTVDDPGHYVDSYSGEFGELVQSMEYFQGRRWAIGIRDINVLSNAYHQKGVLVSSRFNVDGIVDRVALDVEVEIPESWDQDVEWIKFYVSPNNGLDWFQISRIQDDFNGIPEIIAFNDPTPNELREPGVGYYEVDEEVDNIRLKVEMSRPNGDEFGTPLLRPYTLKVKKRS